jgi:RND family efflux transporter, MFP subunit
MKKMIILAGLFVLCACANRSQNQENTNMPYMAEDGSIIIPEGSPILSSIQTQGIKLSTHRSSFSTSGTVQAISSKYAEIATPFAGRITKSLVRLGQKVLPGSPIFELSSPDFFELGKAYFQAKQEMELAQKSLNRERDLLKNDVGVAKDVEEAETNFELRKKDYENALAALSVYQIDADKMSLGQPLVVKSPIAGKVVKSDIVIGQYIKDDAAPLAIVADLDKVWVIAHVKEKDLPLLYNIENVEVFMSAMPEAGVAGVVYHIGELLDETTRTVEVIIECDNPNHNMKPFMYGTVHFYSALSEAILLPSTAIMQEQESDYVLVELAKGKFTRRKVNTETVDTETVRIVSGLSEGENVAVTGGIYLNM